MLKDFASQQNLPVTNNKNAGNAEYFSNPALFAAQQLRLLLLPSIKKGMITDAPSGVIVVRNGKIVKEN